MYMSIKLLSCGIVALLKKTSLGPHLKKTIIKTIRATLGPHLKKAIIRTIRATLGPHLKKPS